MTQTLHSHTWVDSQPAMEQAVASLRTAGAVAVDTEADSRHHYPEKTCLIQITGGDDVFIVDPLADVDVKLLGPIFEDPAVPKLFHGADFDLRGLNRDWGFELHNVYDTNVSSRFAGLERFGLAGLVEDLLGKELPKDQRLQRADWSKRPLSDEALDYAAGDVVYLFAVREEIDHRIASLGRTEWVTEELERLEQIRWVAPDPEQAFFSAKGAHKLDDKALGVLRSLYQMRDAEARRIDRPTAFVLPTEAMITIAADPKVDLAEVKGIGHNILRRLGPAIRKAIKDGVAHGPVKRPPPQYPFRPRPTPEQNERLKRLKAWRISKGEELNLDAALVWPMRSLERLAREPEAFDAERDAGEVRRWQWREFADLIRPSLSE